MSQQLRQVGDPYLEWYDALTLRAPNYPREHLRRHLANFHILVRQTVEKHLHHPGDDAVGNVHEIAVEED